MNSCYHIPTLIIINNEGEAITREFVVVFMDEPLLYFQRKVMLFNEKYLQDRRQA